MEPVVLDKPYQFVPPFRSTRWFWFFRRYVPWYVRRHHGIEKIEWRGLEHIRASLAAGHGIMLAANHCRPADPPLVGLIEHQIHIPAYLMASWHLFMQGRLSRWMLQRAGAFSVYREGMDREALKAAVDLLVEGKRPLIIFPEGTISRCNDRLAPLQDGTSFIARTAARHRAALPTPGKVVIHPVALHYYFEGDLKAAVDPVLATIERRLSWQPRPHWPLRERITAVGEALFSVQEIAYLGRAQPGPMGERLPRLIDAMLHPAEKEWLGGPQNGLTVVERVKRLRSAILPDMVANTVTDEERARRWRLLTDAYYAQQYNNHPPDYLEGQPSVDRVLETVERFEEDLTDRTTPHRPFRVVMQIDEAIEVGPGRERRGGRDPLTQTLEDRLRTLLAGLAREATTPSPFAP